MKDYLQEIKNYFESKFDLTDDEFSLLEKTNDLLKELS